MSLAGFSVLQMKNHVPIEILSMCMLLKVCIVHFVNQRNLPTDLAILFSFPVKYPIIIQSVNARRYTFIMFPVDKSC